MNKRQELLEELKTSMQKAGVSKESLAYFLDEQQTKVLSDDDIERSIKRYSAIAAKKANVEKKIKSTPDDVKSIADRILLDYEKNVDAIIEDVRNKETNKLKKEGKEKSS